MTTPILDWEPSSHRTQNAQHRLAGLDCYAKAAVRPSIQRAQPLNLNQGNQGACTGFGCAHALAASPKSVPNITEDLAFRLYYQARREDEWEGENYDGSSVNGVMHAARTLGYISSWRWANTVRELQHGLSYHGAAVMGSAWKEGMWEPDSEGYIHAVGSDVGGHAYCVPGFRRAPWRTSFSVDYWIDNSWSEDWGLDGGCWITDEDAYSLWFGNWGEVAFPNKI